VDRWTLQRLQARATLRQRLAGRVTSAEIERSRERSLTYAAELEERVERKAETRLTCKKKYRNRLERSEFLLAFLRETRRATEIVPEISPTTRWTTPEIQVVLIGHVSIAEESCLRARPRGATLRTQTSRGAFKGSCSSSGEAGEKCNFNGDKKKGRMMHRSTSNEKRESEEEPSLSSLVGGRSGGWRRRELFLTRCSRAAGRNLLPISSTRSQSFASFPQARNEPTAILQASSTCSQRGQCTIRQSDITRSYITQRGSALLSFSGEESRGETRSLRGDTDRKRPPRHPPFLAARGRRGARKPGREERPGGQAKDTRLPAACLLAAKRVGIDPVCRAALVFGAQTFARTCPACSRRPIIVDSKDIIRKRERERGRERERERERETGGKASNPSSVSGFGASRGEQGWPKGGPLAS